jgi:hypothetical protein
MRSPQILIITCPCGEASEIMVSLMNTWPVDGLSLLTASDLLAIPSTAGLSPSTRANLGFIVAGHARSQRSL